MDTISNVKPCQFERRKKDKGEDQAKNRLKRIRLHLLAALDDPPQTSRPRFLSPSTEWGFGQHWIYFLSSAWRPAILFLVAPISNNIPSFSLAGIVFYPVILAFVAGLQNLVVLWRGVARLSTSRAYVCFRLLSANLTREGPARVASSQTMKGTADPWIAKQFLASKLSSLRTVFLTRWHFTSFETDTCSILDVLLYI